MAAIVETQTASIRERAPLGGSRIERGSGFHRVEATANWIDDEGSLVTNEETLTRLRKLAIPPAWIHVWASSKPDDRVQATGVDSRARTQYRYAATATAFASDLKFAHMIAFAGALPSLRARVAADLRKHHDPSGILPADQVIAGIVRLLDLGLFRVGNERYARDNHTYGLTTIRREHLSVKGSGVSFDFIGKEHVHHHATVVDRGAARLVSALLEQPGSPDAEVFVASAPTGIHSIHSTEVNAYLHSNTGAPATAKVFRTWGATAVVAAVVAGAGTLAVSARTVEEGAVKAAATLLGNTPAVARSSYIHPAAFDAGRTDAVVAAVGNATEHWHTGDVQVLFVDPGVQAAVLESLRAMESNG